MIVLIIFHTILKIALIVLAVILTVIALILFFPVTYKVSGKFNGGVRLRADFQWLFYIVFLRVTYDTVEKKTKAVLRILGIPIQLYPKKPKRVKKSRKTKEPQQSGAVTGEKAAETLEIDPDAAEDESAEAAGEMKKKSKLRSIPERFRRLKEKAASAKEKAAAIGKELTDPQNKAAVKHLLSELKTLLSHYKPRHLRMKLSFSTGDPARTGELLGVLSVFPFAYQRGNRVIPDFVSEKAYLKGNASLSGHIISCYAVAALIRIAMDKNIRRMRKHIKAVKG